jgi:6-pyruvoyltetrahydropterin/6-carboxytetrahydropterin synthase
MITATRRLQYAIGHRVYKHESKCRALHGHNYVFLLTARAPELDALGRVIDFGVLKERFGTWLEMHWDHGFLLWEQDEEAIAAVRMVSGQKYSLLPWNPTAENIARFLLEVVGPRLLQDTHVELMRVVVYETENCIAEVTL